MEAVHLFVPGRLCLFGEHSDWAGGYRRINSHIHPGFCIVTGINEGIYAYAAKYPRLSVQSILSDGTSNGRFECEMDARSLRDVAEKGGFYAYIAGVASFLQTHHQIGGIKLDCYKMDMPLAQGLSSSAAICVLAARAFNRIYNLSLTVRGEMEAAYRGELLTPSRCGRLDQACAYGSKPVLIRFDGDTLDVEKLKVGAPLYWVYSSLNGNKNTVKILQDLNAAYPFANNERHTQLHGLLGEKNLKMINAAVSAMAAGDAPALGQLMTEAQELFDKCAGPLCEELTAPILHQVLNDKAFQPYIYGGKGVGSQGDGSVQFLARDEDAQSQLIQLLREKGFPASALTINVQHRVTRAVIPVAGLGTRMFPATKIIKKDFLPVVGKDGLCKIALFALLEELDRAGIDHVCLVVGKGETSLYRRLFEADEARFEHLKPEQQQYELWIRRMGGNITIVEQEQPLGFGHAVLQSRVFAQDEPVVLLLGDHLYESADEESNCVQQLLGAYNDHAQKLTLGITPCETSRVHHYGIVHGKWGEEPNLLTIDKMMEKPDANTALRKMNMGTAKKPLFYSVFGLYVLTPDVFAELSQREAEHQTSDMELTAALEKIRDTHGAFAALINGRRYDLGLPREYRNTVKGYGK